MVGRHNVFFFFLYRHKTCSTGNNVIYCVPTLIYSFMFQQHDACACSNCYPLVFTDHPTVCLFSIWFGHWFNCGPICPGSCLDLLSCCFPNKQGEICCVEYFRP